MANAAIFFQIGFRDRAQTSYPRDATQFRDERLIVILGEEINLQSRHQVKLFDETQPQAEFDAGNIDLGLSLTGRARRG
jgi:hypothetical protein